MPITRILFLAQGILAESQNGVAGRFSEALQKAAPEFEGAKGFAFASVKWRPKGKFLVNRRLSPEIFGKDAPDYPVRGGPQLAETIARAAEAAGLWAEATEEWGFDPGCLQPLMALRPQGNVLVLPLSLSQMSPEAHRKWGITVRRGLQKWPEPLALIVSGSLSFRLDIPNRSHLSAPDVEQFDEEVIRIFTKGPLGQLEEVNRKLFQAAQPEGGWGSLYFLWGALGDNAAGKNLFYERPLPGVGVALFSFSL